MIQSINIKYTSFLVGVALIFNSCTNSDNKVKEEVKPLKKQIENTTVFEHVDEPSRYISFQKKKNLQSYNFKGNVSSVNQTNYWFKKTNKGIVKTPKKLKTDVYKYNREKQMTVHDRIADDGELFFTNNYTYDSAGYLTAYFESNDVRFVVSTIPIYSTDEFIFKESHLNKFEISIGNSLIELQDSLHMITKTTSWTGSKTKNKIINRLDKRGNVIFKMQFETLLDQKFGSAAESVTEYTYTSNDLILEEKQYNPWGMFDDYKDRLKVIIQNEYDSNDMLIKSTFIKKDGSIDYVLTYLYKLDKHGNWVERTTVKNEIKESLLLREIIYFE